MGKVVEILHEVKKKKLQYLGYIMKGGPSIGYKNKGTSKEYNNYLIQQMNKLFGMGFYTVAILQNYKKLSTIDL
ncbi:hypothetical protein M0802_004357 [Mischocyttarus mexicanus]|nr:hypothetical protein M0802_004357 [Mischocyttarus mexicanus]